MGKDYCFDREAHQRKMNRIVQNFKRWSICFLVLAVLVVPLCFSSKIFISFVLILLLLSVFYFGRYKEGLQLLSEYK